MVFFVPVSKHDGAPDGAVEPWSPYSSPAGGKTPVRGQRRAAHSPGSQVYNSDSRAPSSRSLRSSISSPFSPSTPLEQFDAYRGDLALRQQTTNGKADEGKRFIEAGGRVLRLTQERLKFHNQRAREHKIKKVLVAAAAPIGGKRKQRQLIRTGPPETLVADLLSGSPRTRSKRAAELRDHVASRKELQKAVNLQLSIVNKGGGLSKQGKAIVRLGKKLLGMKSSHCPPI
uniref:Uncharacterized protein n=1 Tax=Calcidiscus leptoporus TaxID=127549 RepID=A0A7S0NQM1_9EUKA|mmetsp:Transcript_14039/g.31984  ORF Transcript_14039/g.31984 Transcript_14039/m.31984 type:complete len:230 (+) Transcript_14039:125-814(+)